MSDVMKYTKFLRRFSFAMAVLMAILGGLSGFVAIAGLILKFVRETELQLQIKEMAGNFMIYGISGCSLFLLWHFISAEASKIFKEIEITRCPFTLKTANLLHKMSALFFVLAFIPQNLKALFSWILTRGAYTVWPVKFGYIAMTLLLLFLEKIVCYGAKMEAHRYCSPEEWYQEKSN